MLLSYQVPGISYESYRPCTLSSSTNDHSSAAAAADKLYKRQKTYRDGDGEMAMTRAQAWAAVKDATRSYLALSNDTSSTTSTYQISDKKKT